MGISNINYVSVSNCIVDQLEVRENTSGIDLSNIKGSWEIDTFLLAKFLGDLEAGNVSLGGLTITDWKIRRRRVDSTTISELTTIPMSTTTDFYYLDSAVRPTIDYEWEVSPLSNGIEGQPFLIQLSVSFDYWWLSDASGTGSGESYPFYANLELSDVAINKQRFQYDTFNKYPVISYGYEQYRSGTITAWLLDAFQEVSVAYRQNVENFVNNQLPKYLRNPQGDMWMVDTNTSTTKFMPYLTEPATSITFSYTEIGDCSNL